MYKFKIVSVFYVIHNKRVTNHQAHKNVVTLIKESRIIVDPP